MPLVGQEPPLAQAPLYLVIAAVAFLGVVLAIIEPMLIAALAVPGVLIVHRVGGADLNLSVSDLLTVAGTAAALPFLRSDMRTTQRILKIGLLYEVIMIVVVAAHPNTKSIFEWWHRLFLVGGCIIIGAALGRARRASLPVIAFLVLAFGLAVAAIVTSLSNGLAPAYPFGLQKNFVGDMTAAAVLIAFLRPTWLRLKTTQLLPIALVCAGGLLASQSRGAVLALVAGMLVAAIRQGRVTRKGLIAIVVLAPLLIFTVVSLTHESDQHTQFNSFTLRADYTAQAFHEWHLSPLLGQGLRYFKLPNATSPIEAHNVVASALGEGGVVGLAALALLVGLTLAALWRLPAEVAAVAIALVVGRFVHGLFDIYWVAGPSTLPWLIVGIVCGAADADASEERSLALESTDARPLAALDHH
jgi:polysaccharide biosynthesis protein PslJ